MNNRLHTRAWSWSGLPLFLSPCWWGEEQTLRCSLNVFHQTDGTADGHWAEMNRVGSLPPFCVISFSEQVGSRAGEVEENKQQPSSTDAAASCWLLAVGTIVFVLTWASITQTDWAEEAEHCFLSLCCLHIPSAATAGRTRCEKNNHLDIWDRAIRAADLFTSFLFFQL